MLGTRPAVLRLGETCMHACLHNAVPVLCCSDAPALTKQVSCKAAPGDDLPVNIDTLGESAASGVRNYAFASFWVQLPLTIVSACILIFAVLYSRGVS